MAIAGLTVVLVYQRMLPYHKDRFDALSAKIASLGGRCFAVEVASIDSSYGDIDGGAEGRYSGSVIRLFDSADYLTLQARDVAAQVCDSLKRLGADVVFSPAPAFAEGAGALHYKVRHGGKLILMDDAWSATDHTGWVTRMVKRLFYGYIDGGFFPARLHGGYFAMLNIPLIRQRYGVNAVAPFTQYSGTTELLSLSLETPFLVFVGRLVAIKNLEVVLDALASVERKDVSLVVIGDGPELTALQHRAQGVGVADRVRWMGRLDNQLTRQVMAKSVALVLPSRQETWGLVVNEAWSAGVPVIGSDTVGALRASLPPEMAWTMPPRGDSAAWRLAIDRLFSLTDDDRDSLIATGYALANRYSLVNHVESAIELIELAPRPPPAGVIGLVASLWQGRVAVW
ncbi:MAG: glycosyltransferase family 4 protein [Porticoccaceae bacterium]|jgi:glycosyltransferase involved in cell wall biosynthesis|nr:glycosyltransferase family 4 protein [Porticoccaceae bacterium]